MASGVHSSPASLAVNTALGYGLTAPGWCCCISEGRPAQGTAETSSTQPVDRIELYLEGAGKQEEEAASSALSAEVSERLFLHALSGCPLPLRQGHVGV